MSDLRVILSLVSFLAISQLSIFLYKRLIARSPLDNVPGPPGTSFFKGSLAKLFNFRAWDFHRELAQKYGGVVRIKGIFGENMLYVFDPLAMHHILVKDGQHYGQHSAILSRLIFGEGLLGTTGDVHRKQRKMLNPIFSAAHMKEMVPLFYDIGHKMESVFAQRVRNGSQEIDVLGWAARTALELIAQSGLGSSFDQLTESAVPHPYANAAKDIILFLSKTNVARMAILPFAMKIGSAKIRRTLLELVPLKTYREGLATTDLMYNTAIGIYQSKKAALAEGDGAFKDHIAQGKDLISVLMRQNLGAANAEKLTEKEIIGQVSTFTFAATDTTSAAISRTLWVLSQHQDVQDKVRAELRDAMSGKESLPYDELVGLKYLDAVCRELLRIYSPVSSLIREANEDMILPLYSPVQGVNGELLNEIFVPKKTKIFLSIFNSNRNPATWGADADEFKPERWLNQLPDAVINSRVPGVYSNLMTFGGGSRSCIGFKFSQLEMKVILSILLSRFRFSLPKDKEIYWNMSGIASPCVVGPEGPSPPRLPLVVELAKQ